MDLKDTFVVKLCCKYSPCFPSLSERKIKDRIALIVDAAEVAKPHM